MTFAALADPTRRAILARLAAGPASVTDLAAPFTMTLPAVSKHLKVLERAGLITRGRDAQWRPCSLKADPLKDVADWVGTYRRFWDESFDRLHRTHASESVRGRSDQLHLGGHLSACGIEECRSQNNPCELFHRLPPGVGSPHYLAKGQSTL